MVNSELKKHIRRNFPYTDSHYILNTTWAMMRAVTFFFLFIFHL